MSTLVKILLAALAGVVLIFIAIAVAVAFVFEPNDYRPLVVDSVKDATGRDLALDGDLELKLFPCCGVRVGSATLGNPPGFPEESFASIDSASVSVKIWPLLLRREVQIGVVALNGLDVHLIELSDGRANWEFDAGAETTQVENEAGASFASLSIEGLEISNGNVVYTGADGARYSARDILVDAGAIGGDAAVPVAVKLTARDETAGTSAELELTTTLRLTGDLANLDEPRLTVRATGTTIPTGEANVDASAASLRYDTAAAAGTIQSLDSTISMPGSRIEVRGDVELAEGGVTGSGEFQIPEANLRQLLAALPDADYQPAGADSLKRLSGGGRWTLTQTGAALSGLDLELDASRITGSVGVTSFDTGAVSADLSIDRFSLDGYLPPEEPATKARVAAEPTEVPFESLAALLVDAKLKIAELSAKGIALQGIDAKVQNDGRRFAVALESSLFGGRAKLNGSGNPIGAAPALAGQLELSGLSPRAAFTALGETLETANPDALTRLSGSTRWQLGSRSLELEQMRWQLDDTQLTGTLGVDGFDAPATRFELALDHINLDDYLAPDTENTAAGDGTDVEIPAELIRGLNIQGQLKAAALRVKDLNLENLAASVNAQNGVLRLEPLTASLYGGTYKGNIVIDATGAKSKLRLDQQLSAVQIGQLLDSLVGSDRIAGSLTLNLTGSGEGNTQNEILKALTGDVAFSLSDGVYHGMDIAYEIENAQSLLKRGAAPERPNLKETPIRALAFSGKMADGVLGSDDLNAEIPFLKLGGKGGVNLVERTLDYKLNAQVQKSADNDAASRIKGLGDSIVPLSISGSMADPKVGVNLQGLVVETVKERARDELFKRLGLNRDEPAAGAGTTPGSDAAGASTEGAANGTPGTGSATTPPAAASATETAAAPPAANQVATTNAAAPDSQDAPTADATEPPSTRDLLERGLRDLLGRRKQADSKDDAPQQ